MPGRGRDDRVVGPPSALPVLELGDLNLDSGLTGELGHPPVDLHAQHRAAGRLTLPGRDPRAAADVEDIDPETGGGDSSYQCLGVVGSSSVVALGIRAERRWGSLSSGSLLDMLTTHSLSHAASSSRRTTTVEGSAAYGTIPFDRMDCCARRPR